MRCAPWIVGCALLLPACGGGGSGGDPPEVTAADVAMPADAPAAVKRLEALLEELTGPLAVGKDLPQVRPKADELAIVADGLGPLAAKSYDQATAAKLTAKAKEIAVEGRKLAGYLRKGDAEKGKVVHTQVQRLVVRLKEALPKAPKKEE